jgi:hypothetical protein
MEWRSVGRAARPRLLGRRLADHHRAGFDDPSPRNRAASTQARNHGHDRRQARAMPSNTASTSADLRESDVRAGYLGALAAGVAAGVAVFGSAAATPAASAAPAVVKTVTHHYSLAASAFFPDGLHNTADDYKNLWDPSTLSNTDGGRCFNAGLSLPTGITLKSVTVYYTTGSDTLLFNLNRQDLINHTSSGLAEFSSVSSSTSAYTSATKPIPAADAAVDYTKYAYSASVCPNPGTTFSGLDITYTQGAG